MVEKVGLPMVEVGEYTEFDFNKPILISDLVVAILAIDINCKKLFILINCMEKDK